MNNHSVKHVGGGFNPKLQRQSDKLKGIKKPKYLVKTSEERQQALQDNMKKLFQESPDKNMKVSCINSLSTNLNTKSQVKLKK